jgi:hypothetical protein
MSKNSIEGVKHSIYEQAMGNYKSYPADYESADTVATEANVSSLAKGYWDSRDDKEVHRDEKLGINLSTYQQWTHEAFDAYMKNNAN